MVHHEKEDSFKVSSFRMKHLTLQTVVISRYKFKKYPLIRIYNTTTFEFKIKIHLWGFWQLYSFHIFAIVLGYTFHVTFVYSLHNDYCSHSLCIPNKERSFAFLSTLPVNKHPEHKHCGLHVQRANNHVFDLKKKSRSNDRTLRSLRLLPSLICNASYIVRVWKENANAIFA